MNVACIKIVTINKLNFGVSGIPMGDRKIKSPEGIEYSKIRWTSFE